MSRFNKQLNSDKKLSKETRKKNCSFMPLFYNTSLFVAFILLIFNLSQDKQDKGRIISSVETNVSHQSDMKIAQPTYIRWSTKKLAFDLTLFIEKTEGELLKGKMATLKATIRSERDLNGVVVSWSIPDSLQVVSGSLEEKIINFESSKEFFIRLRSNSNKNVQIFLQAKSINGPVRFSRITRYNSTGQEELNSVSRNLAREHMKARKRNSSRF